MKIDSINIYGEKIRIKHKDNLYLNGREVWGVYSYADKTITINNVLTKKGSEYQYLHTLMHEAGHATIHILSVCQTSLSPDVEEILVDTLPKIFLKLISFDKKRT